MKRVVRKRHPPRPRCRKAWTAEQRLAFRTKRDPLSGCLIWQGELQRGYGRVGFGGLTYMAHRWAWMIKHGPIPKGRVLCHRCDERRCVNTEHLFLGTQTDNMADLRAKRMRRADARAETASRMKREYNPDAAPIRIFFRGVELIGEVVIARTDSLPPSPPSRRATRQG